VSSPRPRDRFPFYALALGLVLFAGLAASLRLPQRLWTLAFPAGAAHQLDGVATAGEYAFQWSDDASKIVLRWSVVGDRLIGAVMTPDTGWVAVGFGGTGPLMYGADILLGWVDARGAHVRDHYANSPTGHVPDSTIGGQSNVLGAAGTQTAEGTTIEFERSLAAHDTTDHAIEAGQTHVIVASAESDDPTMYHMGGRKAVALLDLFAGPPAAAGAGTLLPDHLTDVEIMLACWMAVLLIIGIHGVATRLAEHTGGEGEARGEPSGFAVALLVLLVAVELLSLGVFALGVHRPAPVWVLGLTLAVGLLALAGIIVVYTRVLVRFAPVRTERDDGIPW
jgi:hypothetical protein